MGSSEGPGGHRDGDQRPVPHPQDTGDTLGGTGQQDSAVPKCCEHTGTASSSQSLQDHCVNCQHLRGSLPSVSPLLHPGPLRATGWVLQRMELVLSPIK